jgi:hypothetical protein
LTGASKRRGDEAEREAAALLADLLGYPIRRKLGAGRLDDVGDLDGLPATTLQVAAWTDALRAVREKPLAVEEQRTRAQTTFAATLVPEFDQWAGSSSELVGIDSPATNARNGSRDSVVWLRSASIA